MASISSLGIGSGLDLNGLLDQLRDAERGKLEPIVAQQQQQESRISALGKLQSAMTQFDDSVATLNDASLYESLSASGGGDALSASVDATAQPGSYSVEVSQLATAGTLATQRVAAPDADIIGDTATSLELTFAEKDDQEPPQNVTVSVDVAVNSTLEDIRDAINAKENAGVSASIVNDGEGYRLALNSSETGEEASIETTNFKSILSTDTQNVIDADNTNKVIAQAGQDAALKVNGIDITSANNTVEGAIQGVTLDLKATTGDGQPTTLKVEQDTLKVREAVSGFVKSFNALKETIGTLTSYNSETGQAGELNGDRTVRTVESRLRSVLSGGVPGSELSMLSEVGITLQRDGTLELDEDVLSDQVSGNMAALGEFFAGSEGSSGMAERVGDTLGRMLDDESGLVSRSIEGAEGRMERLGERYTRMEASVERTIDRYRTQFGQLDAMIANMNQTSSYLTQQFDALDAQLGRK
ncbi:MULTISPECIES: flagellar filament capping protein FliD [unclassified Halomonas]|uniref:flagellar filament capping protein FliD n=1 Tax=unclassified Halomonas TaxID=2609666 RepID=UPI002888C190|nr:MULTISPECIES: flagellar filament capping protein FliD [unclassified Halomonas]MDT0500491.1 flagellar filament capping protein FliD [Halomonas sp. PAR7]MDT0511613.1 flagellar filament capping protein FliD [Halomonas sp. LES1]MDT0590099.1 flagellar filament capping protein FliD [Halomonas sp. PAR8]